MEELSIRRNRSFAALQRQSVSRPEKSSSTVSAQKTVRGTGLAVSETLRQLMDRVSQAASHTRESRRTLQMGEGVLAEVQEKLGRMAELAEEAESAGPADREALQAELEQLRGEIGRMLGSAEAGGAALFTDEGMESAGGAEGAEDVPPSAAEEGAKTELPDWLLKAVVQGTIDTDRLLAELGLDKTASGADVLAALAGRLPESGSAAGYLAALYLGAVIAGGPNAGNLDPTAALDGLRRLLEATADGVPLDEAVKLLTGGQYASLADFQEQFSSGAMPGLQDFLTTLLLTGDGDVLPEIPSLLTYMTGFGGMELDLMMALLTAGQVQPSAPGAGQDATGQGAAAAQAETAEAAAGAALPDGAAQPMEVMRFGEMQVMGRDLSGVSYDEASGRLTIGGTADVAVQGAAGERTVLLTGSGTVTVLNLRAEALTVESAQARIVTAGENTLGEVRLGGDTVLTLDGRGLLRTGAFRGGEGAELRLTGGAVELTKNADGTPGILTVPVVVDGPASLAAQAASVRSADGQTLEPFDILWQTLLPGFSAVTSMELGGHHAKMALLNGQHADAVRIWLAKGDPSGQGYPAHGLTIRGRDEAGRTRTRYAYLQWDQRAGRFREKVMYPNPFTVTGGEQDTDWTYEEETCTLRILTAQVTAIAGGMGTDARQETFSGRIDVEDRVGALKLALGGVVCRVPSGRAFHLGRENDVTLVLRSGTANLFESGEGCAGISLGDGTSLRVDCTPPRNGETAGTLTATGGAGSVGIGQDNGRDRSGHIMIRGGVASSSEKQGAAGSVTIAGSAAGGSSDLGSAKTWARMGIFLQMGEDAVILPQFPLSSRTLQLNKLRVSTREYARAARMTIDADRRWVSQIQSAYSGLSNRMEQSIRGLDSAGEYFGGQEGVVRDSTAASVLLRQISRSAPILSDRAMQARSLKSLEDVNRLLR